MKKGLKILLWIIVPYIMIFFAWRKTSSKSAKLFMTAWSIIALLIGISGNHSSNSNSSINATSANLTASSTSTNNVQKADVPNGEKNQNTTTAIPTSSQTSSSQDSSGVSKSTTSNNTSENPKPVQSTVSTASNVSPSTTKNTEQEAKGTVKILSKISPVARNSNETVIAKVPPHSTAHIEVDYKSGASHAHGLGDKTAGDNGEVSWTWHVGGNSTIGYPVTVIVTDNGQSDQTTYQVVH
jgi:hypothetical protein